MDSERAYNLLLKEVAASAELGVHEYTANSFGNFIIHYRTVTEPGAFTNDRGQILHYRGAGWDHGELLVDDLRNADEQSLIDAVSSKLR